MSISRLVPPLTRMVCTNASDNGFELNNTLYPSSRKLDKRAAGASLVDTVLESKCSGFGASERRRKIKTLRITLLLMHKIWQKYAIIAVYFSIHDWHSFAQNCNWKINIFVLLRESRVASFKFWSPLHLFCARFLGQQAGTPVWLQVITIPFNNLLFCVMQLRGCQDTVGASKNLLETISMRIQYRRERRFATEFTAKTSD